MVIATQPLVTVYIPTYNRIKLLKRAVKSVQDQTYQNLEIIIVDDCSVDGTREYLIQLAKEDTRVRYFIKEHNSGACVSRNIAIKNAKGKFITGLDDDDFLGGNHIQIMVNNKDLLSKYCFLFMGINFVDKNNKIKRANNLGLVEVSHKELLVSNVIGNQVFIKTDLLKAYMFNQNLIAWQDLGCWFNILKSTGSKGLYIGIGEYYCDTGHDYSRITKSSKEKILLAYETFGKEYNLNRSEKKILSFHLLNYGISIPFINMINIFIYIISINKFIFYFYFIKKFFLNIFMMIRGY